MSPWKEKIKLESPSKKEDNVKSEYLNNVPRKTFFRSLRGRMHHLRKRVDFCLGIAEMAAAIREKRHCRLSAQFCLHTNEVVLAINNSLEEGLTYKVKTSFESIDPMPWAKNSS